MITASQRGVMADARPARNRLDLAWAEGLACAGGAANAIAGDRLGRRGSRRPDHPSAAAAAVAGGPGFRRPQPEPRPVWRGDGHGRLPRHGAAPGPAAAGGLARGPGADARAAPAP